jgi:hypothetical protein
MIREEKRFFLVPLFPEIKDSLGNIIQHAAKAKKEIGGGRLRGMTDINPMWRIKTLTEHFGVCGFGWTYKITNKHIEEGANGEMSAFVDIELKINIDGKYLCGEYLDLGQNGDIKINESASADIEIVK